MFRQGESLGTEQTRLESPKTVLDNIFSDIKDKIYEINGETKYYTTEEHRLKHTPKDGDRGEWTGVRGKSTYVPADKTMQKQLAEYGCRGIDYKNCEPIFKDVAHTSVTIEMTEHHFTHIKDGKRVTGNYEKADTQCAKQWNEQGFEGKTDWTARDVAKWRVEHSYTWHERCDTKTCQLVPTAIHKYFTHSGGCSECKARDAMGAMQQ